MRSPSQAPEKPAEEKEKMKPVTKAEDDRGPEEGVTSANPTETEMKLDQEIIKRKRENEPTDKTRDTKRKKEENVIDEVRMRSSVSRKKIDALAESEEYL